MNNLNNQNNNRKNQDIEGPLSLSATEKQEILNKVHERIQNLYVSPFYSFKQRAYALCNSRKPVACAALSLVLIFSAGYGVVAASEYSIPGDLFYPIKTKVVEEIGYTLTPQNNKVAYTEKLLKKRVDELKQIIEHKDEVKQEDLYEIQDLIVQHTQQIGEFINNIPDKEERFRIMTEKIEALETCQEVCKNLSSKPSEKILAEIDRINTQIENFKDEMNKNSVVATSTPEIKSSKIVIPTKQKTSIGVAVSTTTATGSSTTSLTSTTSINTAILKSSTTVKILNNKETTDSTKTTSTNNDTESKVKETIKTIENTVNSTTNEIKEVQNKVEDKVNSVINNIL